MSPVNILIMFLFAHQISLSVGFTHLVQLRDPQSFRCSGYTPATKVTYYSDTTIKVNLVHIFCGHISGKKVSGFHARPGDINPDSADLHGAAVIKGDGGNPNDWSKYDNVRVVYQTTKYNKSYRYKNDVSSFWPTAMTKTDIVNAINRMVINCK